MPEISKCANDDCSKKEQCLRWTMQPSRYQSFTVFFEDKDSKCEHFIKNN